MEELILGWVTNLKPLDKTQLKIPIGMRHKSATPLKLNQGFSAGPIKDKNINKEVQINCMHPGKAANNNLMHLTNRNHAKNKSPSSYHGAVSCLLH